MVPAALPWVGLGLDFLGGMFGANSQAKNAREQLLEQARQFDVGSLRNYRLQGAQPAFNIGRYLENAPTRDQATYLMQQRMGLGPGAMSMDPHGFATSQPNMGVQSPLDVSLRMQGAAQGYKPGMGGQMDPGLYKAILKELGYTSNATNPYGPKGGGWGASPIPGSDNKFGGPIPPGSLYSDRTKRLAHDPKYVHGPSLINEINKRTGQPFSVGGPNILENVLRSRMGY